MPIQYMRKTPVETSKRIGQSSYNIEKFTIVIQ